MKTGKIIDIIQSSDKVSPIEFNSPVRYSSDVTVGELEDSDFATIGMLQEGTSGSRYFIAAGTVIPKSFTTTDIPQLKANSLLQTEISSPFGLPTLRNVIVSDMYIEKVYTNTSKDVVASVNIHGHDDGSGNFAEDTWLLVL